MRKRLSTLIIALAFSSMAGAQQEPLAITYLVHPPVSDQTTTTLTLEVELTNISAQSLSQVSLRLPGPTGKPDEIQGEIFFSSIASGEMKSATGTFLAPNEYFDGATFESLIWSVTYVDSQGQTQTRYIDGIKR